MSETTAKHSLVQNWGQWHRTYLKYDGTESHYDSPVSYRSGSNFTNGVKNPRWKDQVAKGHNAGTSFTGERYVISNRPFILSQFTIPKGSPSPTYTSVATSEGKLGLPNEPAHPSGLSETEANNQAKVNLTRKIRSAQTAFAGGVMAGEMARTIALLRAPTQAFRRDFGRYGETFRDGVERRLRRRQFRNQVSRRRAIVEEARDMWLTAQLGWAPLLGEIDDAIKHIAESQILEVKRWTSVRAVGVDENVVTDNPNLSRLTGWPRWWVAKKSAERVQIRYIACIDVGTVAPYIARKVGIAPTNWLPTIWELIPYSFVVDYFTNIGDIISAATIARSSVRWMLKTVRKETSVGYYNWRQRVRPENASYAFSGGSAVPGTAEIKRTQVIRNPYSGSLTPTLDFKVPGTGTQWLNVAALLDARDELQRWYR